jgi:pyruvate formate lyase activating enzyme
VKEQTLADRMLSLSFPGELFSPTRDGYIKCSACQHRCSIPDGETGICRVRFNEKGILRVPHGWVNSIGIDPMEKKPFYHVLPGSPTLSFGMLGCNFKCGFCQNWPTSQALKDPDAGGVVREITSHALVDLCVSEGAPVITSTYNEPVISAEWAAAVFREARKKGLRTAFVSNGYATKEAVEYLQPWLDFWKVDLKTMNPASLHKTCGGVLSHVLDTIMLLKEKGIWVEVVTLVVPGFNDSAGELREAARFIASVSREIPWHVTAFRGEYHMTGQGRTPADTLLRACETGREAGLSFVYAGNIPGHLGKWENTWCPSCGSRLVERVGFSVLDNAIKGGVCPKCGLKIPGVWL